LRAEDVNHGIQHDLDNLGIAKTAREEKKRARDEKLKQAENERMAKLYREHVLKEKPAPADLVQMIAPATPKSEPVADKEEAVGSFGD
jgi:7,8-dihydro-6-hydroxymethylpterin dimethyltransferase